MRKGETLNILSWESDCFFAKTLNLRTGLTLPTGKVPVKGERFKMGEGETRNRVSNE